MYYYILNLGNKQIAKTKEKMEMMMASFGISGDFGKISPLSSAYELAKRAKGQGYSTIVAIGGTDIINQVAQALVNSDATLGVIPINADQSITNLIGTDSIKKALEILRTRKIETIDIGKISDNKYFLTEATIKQNHPVPTVLDFGNFKIGGNIKDIVIANGTTSAKSYRDGLFEIMINPTENKKSFFRFFKKELTSSSIFHQEEVKIDSEENADVLIGKEVVAKTPCEITLLPFALKLVVARQR